MLATIDGTMTVGIDYLSALRRVLLLPSLSRFSLAVPAFPLVGPGTVKVEPEAAKPDNRYAWDFDGPLEGGETVPIGPDRPLKSDWLCQVPGLYGLRRDARPRCRIPGVVDAPVEDVDLDADAPSPEKLGRLRPTALDDGGRTTGV